VFILKVVKVLYFDTLLHVLILKVLRLHQNCAGLVGGGPAGEAKNAASPKAKSAKMAWRSFT
jgi:hypothetical protein